MYITITVSIQYIIWNRYFSWLCSMEGSRVPFNEIDDSLHIHDSTWMTELVTWEVHGRWVGFAKYEKKDLPPKCHTLIWYVLFCDMFYWYIYIYIYNNLCVCIHIQNLTWSGSMIGGSGRWCETQEFPVNKTPPSSDDLQWVLWDWWRWVEKVILWATQCVD